jgi:D-arabinose 1-dehydrogenase-like Zn-dependent alcohol dehydrogenase
MNYRCAHRWAFTRFGGPLAEMADELPAPTGHEVTVRVRHCGICHSDLHFQAGGFDLGRGQLSSLERAGARLPLTMGHEIGGELVEIGPEVKGIAPGEQVVVYPWIGCGACPVCERGDDHLCPKAMRNLGLQVPGGFADLVRVPHERYLVPIGTLDPARAATFACAGITAMGAIRKLGSLTSEHTVAVIGCGGVGMMGVALLKALTPARVVAIDPDAAKREAALKCGAALAFDPGAADAAKTINKGCGFDIAAAVDFVGSESSSSLAVNLVRRTGQVVIVGLFGGEFRMPLPLFALRSLQITGSYVGGVQNLRELVALAQHVDIPGTPLQLRPMREVNEALADLAAGHAVGRTVLVAD